MTCRIKTWYIALLLALIGFMASAVELKLAPANKIAEAMAQEKWLLAIEIERIEQGHVAAISPADVLYDGQSFRLKLLSSKPSHVRLEVLGRAEGDKPQLTLNSRLKAAEVAFVPVQQQGVLVLDSKPGIEWIRLSFILDTVAKAPLKRPVGQLKQVILRSVELRAGAGQTLDFAPDTQTIYLYPTSNKHLGEMTLDIGLNHHPKTSPLKQ